jgi:tetratricopeptide (TPR) repeat protein
MARLARALASLPVAAALACLPGGPAGRARTQIEAGDLAGARAELERERERQPGSADVRVALGEVYYRIARDALDRERDEARYLAFLERSIAEFVTALEIDPRDDRPHLFLAVMDTYRGELRKALRGLENARRLEPAGVAYTNIAELYVYLGHLHKARRWNELGLRKGAPLSVVDFNDMLIRWKEGDLDEARRLFAELRRSDPETIRTINMARLPEEPRSFDDFAGYCCASPACGPYLRKACSDLELDVREREISQETVRRELLLEMEQARRLRRVYEQRKELEIEVEGAPAASEGSPPGP